MDPVPVWLKELAARTPIPEVPDDAVQNVELSLDTFRKLRSIVDGLVTYVETQLAQCGRP